MMPAGVHKMTERAYFAETDSLSSTGARALLPPSCPAVFRYRQMHPEETISDAFDFGKAAHRAVLGVGPEVVYAPGFLDWRTKAAREFAERARADGAIPLLQEQRARLDGMVAALHANPIAHALLDDEGGAPERAVFARHAPTGVMLRARFDWLPIPRPGRRFVLWDYKTAASAEPGEFARSVARYGYHVQAAFYRHIAIAAGLDADPGFVFVVQEKDPPYVVTVAQLDGEAMRYGEALAGDAIRLYAQCLEADDWPAYSADVAFVSLPGWAL